jgi:hypothetical protein
MAIHCRAAKNSLRGTARHVHTSLLSSSYIFKIYIKFVRVNKAVI